MNPFDLFREIRSEPRSIAILRKVSLVIIYSLLVGYGCVLFYWATFDHPLLLMSSYKEDKSQMPGKDIIHLRQFEIMSQRFFVVFRRFIYHG